MRPEPGNRWLRRIPVGGLLAVAVLFPLARDAYLWSVAEDGPLEWLTALAYLAGAVLAALAAHRLGSRVGGFPAVCYLALAVGLFFIAGEEVSWGQRVLGFDGPPALVEANIQGESNLHNLLDRYALHAVYIAVGLWGSGLGRWVTARVRWLRPGRLYAPGPELVWWFLPVTAYYVYLDYIGARLLRLSVNATEGDLVEMVANGPARFQEAVELVLAGGFLLFVLGTVRWVSRPDQPARGEVPLPPEPRQRRTLTGD